ncbi:hypothetical protein DPEC_G00377190 [Dallia pectoralis]|nr:hypothetical protein DPEC_G00377190 [Dallia pectoralis]
MLPTFGLPSPHVAPRLLGVRARAAPDSLERHPVQPHERPVHPLLSRWDLRSLETLQRSARNLFRHKAEGSMLGAYVRKLDRSSCVAVPGGYKCSDSVVASTPLNKISILLHARPLNRDYYFGDDPMADCGPEPQCAAFKLLRRTLHSPAASRKWPETDDVLTIRNSPYACVLTYVGLGDAESIGVCYAQLGDNCFVSEGNRFCIGDSRARRVGITNADSAASAPVAMCEVSSAASLETRDPAYKPTAREIRDFLLTSSCDAIILSLDRAVYSPGSLSVALDVATFYTVAEAGHVIMKIPFDECLVPVASRSLDYRAIVAETLSKVRVSTRSAAIMLDATKWGTVKCPHANPQGATFTKVAADLASALLKEGVTKLFLRLPRLRRVLGTVDFSQLDSFDAFVTPQGLADMSKVGENDSSSGVMSYLLTLLRQGVRANKVIFTLSLTGGLTIRPLELRDFRRGVRSNTPAILGITSAVHRLQDWKRQQIAAGISTAVGARLYGRSKRSASNLNQITEAQYKDPASGSKNCLDPQYNIGLSNTVVCPGLIAVHGALGIFKEPHKELYSTSYDKIYIVDLYKLESCTPGEPEKRATLSTKPPRTAINIHTLIPTTDRNHYMVGIMDTEQAVEYAPPVNNVCTAYNTGEATQSMNVVSVDDGYAIDKPVVEAKHGVIVKPVEALYFVSNFTPGIDYVNLNVSCINYDVSALRPCLIAICGGDNSCRKDYGRLCNSAHEIINDARRAGEMMREGLEELAVQERKLRWVAALGLAWHVSNRVDVLQEQTDSLKNSYVSVANSLVEVSNKLNTNIALVNSRIDDQVKRIKKNNDIIDVNFAMMRDVMMRNTEAAMRDTNVKFAVMASYQMWYAQMQSVTHQMMQAAMYTKFMAKGGGKTVCGRSRQSVRELPQRLTVMQDHPGLSEYPTAGTALYKDRKFFIVHSVPGTVEKTVVRGVIPMPKMS